MTHHHTPDEEVQPIVHDLVAQSDALDEDKEQADLTALAQIVNGLRDAQKKATAIQERLSALSVVIAVVSFVAVGLGVFGLITALRVQENSNKLADTKEAVKVFCEQTNAYNDAARISFVSRFGRQAETPEQKENLAAFVAIGWPTLDCTPPVDDVEVTVPETISTTVVGSIP